VVKATLGTSQAEGAALPGAEPSCCGIFVVNAFLFTMWRRQAGEPTRTYKFAVEAQRSGCGQGGDCERGWPAVCLQKSARRAQNKSLVGKACNAEELVV